MWTIDVFITNQIGDCNRTRFDLRANSEFFHDIRFRGEPYGAWVSSVDGSFNNVRLNFSNTQQARMTRITFDPNANGATVNPTWRDLPAGNRIGEEQLPTPHRAGHQFVGWFTSPGVTGGTRVTSNWIVPNSNQILFARWNAPSRHQAFWFRPAPSGQTTIRMLPLNQVGDHWGGVRPVPMPSTWVPPAREGLRNWNNSSHWSSPRSVFFMETTESVLDCGRHSWVQMNTQVGIRAYGEFHINREWPAPTGSEFDRFVIELNDWQITAGWTRGGTQLWETIESVMAHELGHAVGLIDRPRGSMRDSIMDQDRDRQTISQARPAIVGPNRFDVDGARMLFN